MEASLLAIIGLLLLFCAYQQWRHEQWASSVISRLSEPPAPPLSYRELERGAYSVWPPAPVEPGMPFMLQRRPDRCVPTRPRFENYGVEVSMMPTIPVDSAPVGRLPSYTLLEFGIPLAQSRAQW